MMYADPMLDTGEGPTHGYLLFIPRALFGPGRAYSNEKTHLTSADHFVGYPMPP
jgi:hypothetical protein